MKTALEIVRDVRSLLMVDELQSQIDGKIYDFYRPLNSIKQDITVSILAADNEWMQQAIVNVRIHSPNPSFNIPGEQSADSTRPDLVTFDRLSKIVCALTDTQYKTTFNTIVTSPGELFKEQGGGWVCVVQLEYRSIQDNFKNI